MTMHNFHWMIVVRNGQVFKYSQKVFKYQHQYLGIWIVFKHWY